MSTKAIKSRSIRKVGVAMSDKTNVDWVRKNAIWIIYVDLENMSKRYSRDGAVDALRAALKLHAEAEISSQKIHGNV